MDAIKNGKLLYSMNKMALVCVFAFISQVSQAGIDVRYEYCGIEKCELNVVSELRPNPWSWFESFASLLILSEECAMEGKSEKFHKSLQGIAGMVRVYDEYQDVFGFAVIRHNRERLEYMLARLINLRNGNVKLGEDDVRMALPKISTMPTDIKHRTVMRKQETFRNMLIIGAAIERFYDKHHFLPLSLEVLSCLKEEELMDAWDSRMIYLMRGEEWLLFSAGGKEPDKNIFSASTGEWEYIPAIDRIGGTVTPEVWFASSFSQKRKELFEKGVINGKGSYKCKLVNGCLYRF